jgi:3-phosphoshikimate 1-carboxyvinyltransferase
MLGLSVESGGVGRITRVQGGMVIQPAEYVVPGDFSSALFLVCAALLVPGSDIVLRNVGLNPTRTRALDILKAVGGRIVVEEQSEKSGEPFGTIRARFSELSGNVDLDAVDIPLVVDEIPVLAAVLSVGGCSLSVQGGTDLRHKESDRISAIVRNLQSMGVPAIEKADGFAFESKKTVFPTAIQTSGDHRIAMAFAVAGMALDGNTTIPGAEIASVSFPDFWEQINRFQE